MRGGKKERERERKKERKKEKKTQINPHLSLVANDATSSLPRYTWNSGTERIFKETARAVLPPPPSPSLSSPSRSTSCFKKTISGRELSPSDSAPLLADLQSLMKPGAMYLFFVFDREDS